MKKGMKRTLLAFMVMAMLASSAAVPAMASNGENPTGGGIPVTYSADLDGERSGTNTNAVSTNGLPEAQSGVITLSGTASYTLTGEVSASIKVLEGANITINLNGQNISSSSGHTIENHGTITITGTGMVSNTASGSYAAFTNYPKATAHLNGGTFEDNSWYTIKNLGTMTINGATVQRTDTGSSLIDNGWYGNTSNDLNMTYDSSQHGIPSLTIYDGTFSGGMNVVKNDDYSVLDIRGGTFSNTAGPAVLNWNVATISGGTFSVSGVGNSVIANGHLNSTADKGQFTITGGNFVAESSQGLFGYGVGSSNGGNIAITGGNFTGSLLTDDNYPYDVAISGGNYTGDNPAVYDYLTDEVEAVVSNSSGTRFGVYTDIQDAADNARSGDTITVYKPGLTVEMDEDSGVRV